VAPTFFYIYSKQEDFNMKIGKYLLAAITALFLFSCSDDSGNDGEKIVCFGNSLTEGNGAGTMENPIDKNNSYPHYLAQKVNVPVINLGVSGDTSEDAVKRIDDVLKHSPAVVFIEFGANDLFYQAFSYFMGGDIDADFIDDVEQNFEIILDRLADGNRKIYLVKFYDEEVARDMILKNTSEEYMWIYGRYETMFANLKSKYSNVSLIENMWDDVWGNSALMSPYDWQEVHANAEGYRIIANNIFNEAREYLESRGFVK
jgi:acyl-CoA thioesterase-1